MKNTFTTKLNAGLVGLAMTASLFLSNAPPVYSQNIPPVSPEKTQASRLMPCTLYKNMAGQLDARFGEKRHAWGIVGQNAVMELFVSKTDTWTIVMTSLDGRSCIIAAGHSYDELPPELAGNPA